MAKRGIALILNHWGGPDYRDILAGVDQMIAQGVADGDRLGVMGASYSGYMTNWVATQTPGIVVPVLSQIDGLSTNAKW